MRGGTRGLKSLTRWCLRTVEINIQYNGGGESNARVTGAGDILRVYIVNVYSM